MDSQESASVAIGRCCMNVRVLLGSGAAMLVLCGAIVVGQSEDNRLHIVLPRDAIPAIDDPAFVRAEKTGNDVFEGRPIAVTW